MKYVSVVLLFFFSNPTLIFAQNSEVFFKNTDAFLNNYVQADGNVDYADIAKNRSELDGLVAFIEKTPLSKFSEKEKKAYLINVYNLLVIKSVVDNYPITSTQKVGGFFDNMKHNIGGNYWTLSKFENEHILKIYQDPRIHFVLNCAALSCPPVTNFAYRPQQLETQLETQTKKALNDRNFIYTKNEKNYLSKIFQWYESDFKASGGVIAFINKYRDEPLNEAAKKIHYPYDWMLNDNNTNTSIGNTGISFIQVYTPSTLLKKGQIEAQLYNNLYTQTAFRDEDRNKVDLNERQNYFTALINFTYGASESANWNIGFDVNVKSVRLDSDKNSSPFRVFKFENDIRNRTAIGSMGPVFKFKPLKNSKLTVKSSFLFPIANDGESDERDANGQSLRPWLDWNRFTFWNQFFYDKNIGSKYQLFLEGDLLFRFAKPKDKYANNFPKENLLTTPLSAFFSYFPTQKSTVYIMLQYAPTVGLRRIDGNGNTSPDIFGKEDYAQTGIGFKYQVSTTLGLELSYTNFFTSANGGAGSTFNLGIRYLQ